MGCGKFGDINNVIDQYHKCLLIDASIDNIKNPTDGAIKRF